MGMLLGVVAASNHCRCYHLKCAYIIINVPAEKNYPNNEKSSCVCAIYGDYIISVEAVKNFH